MLTDDVGCNPWRPSEKPWEKNMKNTNIGKCFFLFFFMGFYGIFPLVICYSLLLKITIYSGFPLLRMVIFHTYVKLPKGRWNPCLYMFISKYMYIYIYMCQVDMTP